MIKLSDDPNEALAQVSSYLKTLKMTSDRSVWAGDEVVGFWQTSEWLEGLTKIVSECDRVTKTTDTAISGLESTAIIQSRLFDALKSAIWNWLFERGYAANDSSSESITQSVVKLLRDVISSPDKSIINGISDHSVSVSRLFTNAEIEQMSSAMTDDAIRETHNCFSRRGKVIEPAMEKALREKLDKFFVSELTDWNKRGA